MWVYLLSLYPILKGLIPLSESELLNAYLAWSNNPDSPVPDPIPLANLDIFEDDSHVVNRLFFLIPDISSGSLRCFFFFEENLFSKNTSGDLTLLRSFFHLFSPNLTT